MIQSGRNGRKRTRAICRYFTFIKRADEQRFTERIRPPLIASRLSPEYGPISIEEVYTMIDYTAQLPEIDHRHEFGGLGGIVPESLDPLDMRILHELGV
jgi:hypothetical protein